MAIDLKTYGDLKKLIKAISLKQKGEKIISQGKEFALDQILGLIPGASNAKTAFSFFQSAFKKPDTKKTGTWLDRLDIDDDMSAIVDDTVENGFMKALSATLEKEPDNKPLEADFNMNARMVDYLRDKHNGRFISGIKENKNNKMAKYNLESLSPDEQTKLKEYISSVKEIRKEIKKLVEKAGTKDIETEGGNMSTGLKLSLK